ncbi:MAG: hypothetical protein EA428_13410 [Spirochaetaceae bacterium]|nr:MAG: hypothetical protein EA428_13410 [Spirochaetaceae bacterium]
MNTYLRIFACAVLLISSLGQQALAFPGAAALLDIQASDAGRAPAWDFIFSRADQEQDAARWTAVTRTLYSSELSEAELEALERYTEYRLGLWLERRVGALPTGELLRQLDAHIVQANSRYLYITDDSGNRLRDDAGDFRLQGRASFDIDTAHWDTAISEAGAAVVREYQTQVDIYALALLSGLDADIVTRLGARYPELLHSAGERFQQHIDAQSAAARRRFVEARTQDTYSLRARSEAQTADAVAAGILHGLDSSLSRAFIDSPELLNASTLIEQARMIGSWEDGFRSEYERGLTAWQEAEDSLLRERVRWEHESLDNVRKAEVAWDEALVELFQRRELWLSEMQDILQETQQDFQRHVYDFTQSYELQLADAEEIRAVEHQQLMGEFNSVLEQVHRLSHLRQMATAHLIEAQHQRAELGTGSSDLATALNQSIRDWQAVLTEIETEQEGLIGQMLELERSYLLEDGVPRSAHEELQFVGAELERLSAAVERAEAVLEYAGDLSSDRATAAESYEQLLRATQARDDADHSLAVATAQLQTLRSLGPSLVTEFEQALSALSAAEQELSASREELARREAFYTTQDPELLEVLRLEQLGLAEAYEASFDTEFIRQLFRVAAEHAAALHFHQELPDYSVAELESGIAILEHFEIESAPAWEQVAATLVDTGFAYEAEAIEALRDLFEVYRNLETPGGIDELHLQAAWALILDEFQADLFYQHAAAEFLLSSEDELALIYGPELGMLQLAEFGRLREEQALLEYSMEEARMQAAVLSGLEAGGLLPDFESGDLLPELLPLDHLLTQARHDYYRAILPSLVALELASFHPVLKDSYWRENAAAFPETSVPLREQVHMLLAELREMEAYGELEPVLAELTQVLDEFADIQTQLLQPQHRDAAAAFEAALVASLAEELLLLPGRLAAAQNTGSLAGELNLEGRSAELAASEEQLSSLLSHLEHSVSSSLSHLSAAESLYLSAAKQSEDQQLYLLELLEPALLELEAAELAVEHQRAVLEQTRTALGSQSGNVAAAHEKRENAADRRAEAHREYETARELYEFGIAGYALTGNSPEAVLAQRRADYERHLTIFTALSAELEGMAADHAAEHFAALNPHSADAQQRSTALQEALVVLNKSSQLLAGMQSTLHAAELRRKAVESELKDHMARIVSGGADWDSLNPPRPFEMLRAASFAQQREADWFELYRAGALAEDLGAFSEALSGRGDSSELLRTFALAYYADTAGITGARVALTVEHDTAVGRLARIIGFHVPSHLNAITSAARTTVRGNPQLRSLYEHYRVLVYHGVFVMGSREINNDVSGQVIEDLHASASYQRRRWKKRMKKVRKAHKYFEFKRLRDETQARMRVVAPRSAAQARAGLLASLSPVVAARSELSLLPQPAALVTGAVLSNAQVIGLMNTALNAMPAAARLSAEQRNVMVSALTTEDRSSWNTVLQAMQEGSLEPMTALMQTGRTARTFEQGEHTTAIRSFRELLSDPNTDPNQVIEHGSAVLWLSPEPTLLESGELWSGLAPTALSTPSAALMLSGVEERFLYRTNTEIGLFAQAAATEMRDLKQVFAQREAVLGELVVQGVEHWEQSFARFAAERNERRSRAERLYRDGLRSFELEAQYLEQQRERWHEEALRLGVESELTGAAERLGLSTRRLQADLYTGMPARVGMQLPDIAQLVAGPDSFQGVRVPDLIVAARGISLSPVAGASVAPYLPSGSGFLAGSEERSLQRHTAAAHIIGQVEAAVTRSSALEMARGIEETRRRALQAVVEGNRRVGDGLSEVLERYGFRSAGDSFERRIIADRTVFGGTEYDRQVIAGYRNFRAPELQLDLPLSTGYGAGLHEFEIAALRARQQMNDFLLLIFGGEAGGTAAVATTPSGARDGLLWQHVGSAGENGAAGHGETGRIMASLNSAQMEQQVGIQKSKTAVYNQRLFNTGHDFLHAPSIREVGVMWGQTVGALAGAETGAAIGRLAMQAVFTGADLYRGDVGWQDAGKIMGFELGSIALSAATSGAFQHIDQTLAISGQGGAAGFAIGLGLDLSGVVVSQTSSRALASIDIGDHGVSFDRSSFTGSMMSGEALTGYLAGGVGLGVTHGLGAVNAGDQRLFGFRSEQYEGVAGLNSHAGLLAGEAVRFAREGELHLNLLNLDSFSGAASLGLLELRLGDSSRAGLALGSGGLDTSYNRLATAALGLDVLNQNRKISAYAREHQQGDSLAEIALRTLYAFGDKGEQRTLYRNLLSGEDRLMLAGGSDATEYRAVTRYEGATDSRVVSARLVGEDRYAGLALGVTLGHEAYRDGIVDAHNSTETLWATTAHTQMAGRIAADDRYGSRYLMADPNVLVDLVMLGAGEDSFAQYVAARYDSSDDYWLIIENLDGTVSLMDDGRGGVYYQGAGGEEHEIGRYRDGDRLEHLSDLLSGLGGSVDAAQLGELIASQGGSFKDGYFLGEGGVLQLDTGAQDMLGARLDYSRMFVEDWRSSGNMDRTVSELAGLIGRNYSYGNSAPSGRETNLAFMYGEATEFYRNFMDGRAQDHLFYQHQVEDSTGFRPNTLCAATIAINAHQLVDPTISMWQIANAVQRASNSDGGSPVLAANGYVGDLHAYTRIIAEEFGSDSYLRALRDFGSASEAWQAGADAVFVKHVNDLVNPTREHHTLSYRYREDDRYRTHGYNQFDPYAVGLSWEQQFAVRYRSMAFTDL